MAILTDEMIACFLMIVFVLINEVNSHGRLLVPPSRSSMWREGFKNPPNYNDNQLFCGGVTTQWGQNGGKCGICGDAWQGPRDNEPGGRYANGIIVRKYKMGQIIKATVELTATHKGYFQFKLCPTDNPYKNVTQECLDSNVLTVADSGSTRYTAPVSAGKVNIKLRLPKDVKCTACVFQWKYNSGNSWGTCENGVGAVGCGAQEQFYGCADIAIGYDDIIVGKTIEKRPWFFEPPDSDWHWGIVGRINNTFIYGGAADSLHSSAVYLTFVTFLLNLLVFVS